MFHSSFPCIHPSFSTFFFNFYIQSFCSIISTLFLSSFILYLLPFMLHSLSSFIHPSFSTSFHSSFILHLSIILFIYTYLSTFLHLHTLSVSNYAYDPSFTLYFYLSLFFSYEFTFFLCPRPTWVFLH